jgi:hypothetical protein
MTERRLSRRQFLSEITSTTVDAALRVASENPQILAPIIASALLLSSSREARASIVNRVSGNEKLRSGCSPLSDTEVAELNECAGPNKAGFYLTAEVFENKNGKPGYQADADPIKRKFTEAEYLIVNTADRSQFYNARVNEFGELFHEVKDKDGKLQQVRVFVFSGTPNDTDSQGRPAIKAEIRNKNAYDKTLDKVVELGDPRYHSSAINCTPLPVYLWKDESYLTPPSRETVKPVPSQAERPAAPYQIPQIQVPLLPASGDGSTPIETNPNIPRWSGH